MGFPMGFPMVFPMVFPWFSNDRIMDLHPRLDAAGPPGLVVGA